MTRRPGQIISDRSGEISQTLSGARARVSAADCGLTVAVPVPIIGIAIAGWLGLLAALVIAGAFSGAAFPSGST